ncbi:cytochrome C oxidase assembly factor COX15, putative [Eimeria tenella]|uniref:Cytochrome C oxidase assembly factor COX15, putative n=1 Tax=Eimeria tenella TaxID=5802 RepID=U6KUX9_EIMTE|nr:cytochrome C oxidase assembly factor COX15, putative [Eimeria tenella]CDJ41776.1 cytochrome C oxidase assembly factor COX15, putative [Eimeria tenella]|eukprot:XP_013232526.1 cytochrome C oxidase assembly factor COX15, putative [Eimeria tenella]
MEASLGCLCRFVKEGYRRPVGLWLLVYGVLGGIQGLVGWWMVRSGFKEPETEVKTPRVSPYRLAFHLVMATGLYALLLWQSLSLLLPSPAAAAAAAPAAAAAAAAAARKDVHAFAALAATTFTSGAFVAGNDAGRCCNTWPKMGDQ